MDHVLGVNDTNLLYASLKMNETADKTLVVRRKILWAHARGDLNIGDSSIATCAMPRLLAWLGGDDSNENNTNLIQYHDPPLQKAKCDTIRLDSVYRILRSRPDLINYNGIESCGETKRLHAMHWAIIAFPVLFGLLYSLVQA